MGYAGSLYTTHNLFNMKKSPKGFIHTVLMKKILNMPRVHLFNLKYKWTFLNI